MGIPTNPSFDLAHLGHVEVLTNKFDESLDFFTRVYGLKLSAQEGGSAYLRAWDDYEFCTLKLTRSETTGVAHIGYRASSPEALKVRVAAIEASGYKTHGWVEGDLSHGSAFRFEDPFGHVFEVYYDTKRAPKDDPSALKNMASRMTGAAPRRIDHLNLLAEDVTEFRRFMETCLGSRVTEMIQLDSGRVGGCWFTVNNRTYDLACTEEHGGGHGRFHHVTFATDQREDILRAADILRRDGSYDQLRTTGRTLEMMQSDALSQTGIAHQICGDDTLFDIFFTNAPCRDFHTAKHDDQRRNAVCNDVLRKHGVFKSPGKLCQSLAITDADLEQSKDAAWAAAQSIASIC